MVLSHRKTKQIRHLPMAVYQVAPDCRVLDAKQLIMRNLAEIGVLAGKLG